MKINIIKLIMKKKINNKLEKLFFQKIYKPINTRILEIMLIKDH